VGASILLIGVLGAVGWFVASVPDIADGIDRLHRASPELPVEFDVAEAVDWDAFLEPSSASRARFRFAIVDAAGERARLGNDHGSTYDWFSRSGRSIASVVLGPGRYRMEVTEGFGTVALGASPTGKIFRAVFGALIIGLLVGGAGVVVMIVSAVRETRRRTQNAELPPPSPWSAGEWPAEPGR
jgi:hypothetical protein